MITYRFRITPIQRIELRYIEEKYWWSPLYENWEVWTENPPEARNSTKVSRRLYGVIGFTKHFNGRTGRTFYRYNIPEENTEAVEQAKKTGWFEKTIEDRDLDVLRSLYLRTQELYDRFGRGWYPGFTETEAADLVGWSRMETRISLDRLVGLLGIFHENHVVDSDNEHWIFKTVATPYWFVPRYREELVRELLFGSDIVDNPNQLWLFPKMIPRRRKDYNIERLEAVPV